MAQDGRSSDGTRLWVVPRLLLWVFPLAFYAASWPLTGNAGADLRRYIPEVMEGPSLILLNLAGLLAATWLYWVLTARHRAAPEKEERQGVSPSFGFFILQLILMPVGIFVASLVSKLV